MNRYKLAGTLIAALLLIVSVIVRYRFATSEAAVLALPIVSVGLWALTVFDTLAYRTSKSDAIKKRGELIQLTALYIISALISVGTVIYIVTGGK
ncbi:MAG: hypothetical protein ACI4T6_10960 [Candidatus Flemingiibacterium sp.]